MTHNAQKAPTRQPPAPAPTPPRLEPARTAFATWLGLTGPDGARRRGSLLRRLLASGDWIALVAALCVATAATRESDVGTLFWAVLFSPIWILTLKLHGLYDNDHRRIRHSTVDELPSLLSASALGTLALDGLLALSPAGPLSAGSAIIVGVGTLIGTFALRAVLRFVWHLLTGVATGVVVGPAAAADIVARRVATHPEARLHLIGFLGPASERSLGARTLPHLGSIADIARVATEYEVERVVVTEQEMSEPDAELPVLDFRFSDPPWSTLMLKRTLDLVVSALLLALFAPLLLVVSLLILVDSGRPVFFRQARAGKDGMPFTMMKFRTMVADAEERLSELVDLENLDEPAFKIPGDPRITRAGRLLRRTSIDELPQFINVLKGDMSLVGPRPEEEAVVALYDERQRIRLAVKPGITGPMQVYGRGDLTFEERLAMERDYLDNLSVTGDLAILLRTPTAIFRGDGAY